MKFRAALAVFLTVPAFCQQSKLDSSRTLFNVLTAINLAGYDAEVDSPNNHPLRAAVRKELAERKLATVAELKSFFAQHRRRDWTSELSQYISFALSVDDNGQYQWRFQGEEIPPDAQALDGFGALMTRFHQEANLDELWKRVEPIHDQALERYGAPISQELQRVSAYLRVPSTGYLGRSFRVYVDLMAAPHHVQVRSYGDETFVILTPSPEPRIEEVRQAFIAFQVDPLATKYAEKLEKKRPLIDLAQAAPALPDRYKEDFLLLTTKSLMRAVEARLAPASRREAMVKQALGEGYILTPYFGEALAIYEKQEVAMRLYYPEMVDAIDLAVEDKRLAQVEFLKEAPVRTVRVQPAEVKAELTGARKTLEDAEDLYRAKKLPDARQLFLKAVDETTEKPLQAKAYFGLARIAALSKDPELSHKLFTQVLELQPEPAVAAWSHVYLGRLHGIAGEDSEAIRHFEEALKVEGASKPARDAAQKALDEARKGK